MGCWGGDRYVKLATNPLQLPFCLFIPNSSNVPEYWWSHMGLRVNLAHMCVLFRLQSCGVFFIIKMVAPLENQVYINSSFLVY